jgi:hypothetical protein
MPTRVPRLRGLQDWAHPAPAPLPDDARELCFGGLTQIDSAVLKGLAGGAMRRTHPVGMPTDPLVYDSQ